MSFGGNYDDSEGFYIEPTVVRDITKDAVIAKEEIFGPVLAVIRVDSFDEALEVANGTEYGLTGSVYTEDREHIQKAKVEFHVGNLLLQQKVHRSCCSSASIRRLQYVWYGRKNRNQRLPYKLPESEICMRGSDILITYQNRHMAGKTDFPAISAFRDSMYLL